MIDPFNLFHVIIVIKSKRVNTWIDTERLADRDAMSTSTRCSWVPSTSSIINLYLLIRIGWQILLYIIEVVVVIVPDAIMAAHFVHFCLHLCFKAALFAWKFPFEFFFTASIALSKLESGLILPLKLLKEVLPFGKV